MTFVHAYAPIVRPMMIYMGITQDRVAEVAEREFQDTRRDVAPFIQDLG
ncbi:MAG: hypothetical protein U0934_00120 [Pseudotabrizicola sp.]|nr:hypothetical protein [Pseudotabrizicola sp.]MDZ7572346.1 hypothetical protein [Pseudotabrizicola sp.]